MRKATFKASGAEISVIVLAGTAGGDLANVNRWRGQIGLSALDDAGLAADSERIESKAGPVLFIDHAGGGKRVSGGILTSGGQTWFFKLMGSPTAIGKALPAFRGMLEGLTGAR